MPVAPTALDALHRGFFRTLSRFGSKRQGELLQLYFDWWHRRADPWGHATDDYEQHKYLTTLGQVPAGDYDRILEVGCSEGTFTRLLADRYQASRITGVDISRRAIGRARSQNTEESRVRFHAMDIINEQPSGMFDLVFCAEMLYYVGRTGCLAGVSRQIAALLAPGGLLVLVHPWPESADLHRHFAADPALTRRDEHVDTDACRPFSVSLYASSAAPVRCPVHSGGPHHGGPGGAGDLTSICADCAVASASGQPRRPARPR